MKKSELKDLIRECLDEMTNLDLSSMNEKKVNPWAVCTSSVGRDDKDKYEKCVKGVKSKIKEDVITNTDPVIKDTWKRHASVFDNAQIAYEAYEQGFLDGYEHAEKKHGIQ